MSATGGPRRLLRWKVKNRFGSDEPIVRMSWNKQNLANMLRIKMLPDLSRMTVYQQKWKAKKYLRGYHVPNITETQFLDRHFKTSLPVKLHSKSDKEKLPPIQSITFGELERRVDVVVFRSCFASSIWNARQMVVHGRVKVNGEECRYPARRLDDGDMITVSPFSIPTLTHPVDESASATLASLTKNTEVEKDAKIAGEELKTDDQDTSAETTSTDGIIATSSPSTSDPSKPRVWKPLDYMTPWIFIPKYLEVDFATCSAVFLRSPLVQPSLMEIPSPFPPSWHQLVFEWYAKKKRAQKKILAKPALVINGQTVKLKPKFDRIVRADLKWVQEKKMKARSDRLAEEKEAARLKFGQKI